MFIIYYSLMLACLHFPQICFPNQMRIYLGYVIEKWALYFRYLKKKCPEGKCLEGKCPEGNVLDPSWADGPAAKMLIISSLKCKETEQTFHILKLSFFPPLKGYEEFCFISSHGICVVELNCTF